MPRPRVPWVQFGLASMLLCWGLAWYFGRQNPQVDGLISVISSVGLAFLVGVFWMVGQGAARAFRAEQAQLQSIEELMRLRRWPEAAMAVQAFLLRPARSPIARAQALLFLAMVLARYHRFEESVAVYDNILAEIPLDDATSHGVQLGRAMALLREDNLLDSDRAIAELRRGSRGIESPELALVELYRDVKTGHPTEAIEMFEKHFASMRRGLGHRLADSWALVARAYDLLGRNDEARQAYANATILAPLGELTRRYPELSPLTEKFAPTPAPAEVMA